VTSTGILAASYFLPSNRLTHEDLENRFGEPAMKKVLSGAGIRTRRVAAPDVCGSDLAFAAAERLLLHHGIPRESIDAVIFCTQTPDFLLPTTACILHERLQLKNRCAALDINLGCTQYVYALSIAHGLILSGTAKRVLVLTGDTMTRTLHPKDRSVVPLFGDGGSASLIGEVPEGQGFVGFELGTDGSGSQYLMIPAGGFRMPKSTESGTEMEDSEGNVRSKENLYMNGAAIFHFAITVVPEMLQNLLEHVHLGIEDVDLFLFHQANKYMLDYVFKKLKIPPEKTHFFVTEIGNTSGSSVPIVMVDAWLNEKVKPGATICLISFGVGLSWAGTILRWPENAMGPVPTLD